MQTPVLGMGMVLGWGAGRQHCRRVSDGGAVDAEQLYGCACMYMEEEKVADSPLFWSGTWPAWWCKNGGGCSKTGVGVALKEFLRSHSCS